MEPRLSSPIRYPTWTAVAALAAAGFLLLLPTLLAITHPTSTTVVQSPAVVIAGEQSPEKIQGVQQDAHSSTSLAGAASVPDPSVPSASKVFAGTEAPIEEQPPTF